MHIETIKIFISNENDKKKDQTLNFAEKCKCHKINKENIYYYTTIGKIIKKRNGIRKIEIFEDTEMNLKINSILKKYKLNNDLILDCSYETEGNEIYNFPKTCYEVKESQEIFLLNENINYILQNEYQDDILINTFSYFEIKSNNILQNIDFISFILNTN